MPVDTLFSAKVDRIREFLLAPGERVLIIQRARDLQPILHRQLLRLHDDDTNPHAFSFTAATYDRFDRFFPRIALQLSEQHQHVGEELAELDVHVPSPPAWPDVARSQPVETVQAFAGYWAATSEALPDDAGSLCLIIEPEGVSNAGEYRWAVECLSYYTDSDWAKYIVIDDLDNPLLAGLEDEEEGVSLLNYNVSPAEVEARVNEDLQGGLLTPRGVQQYAAMAAAFCSARGEWEPAIAHQQRALRAARREGSPSEQATILYNLGTTLLQKGDLPGAEEAFLEGAELAMSDDGNAILAMILTNLGVTLTRGRRLAEAQESFAVARRTFRALGQLPGEAHVLDCAARAEVESGSTSRAEGYWLEALALYRGILNPDLHEVRRSGEAGVRDALARLYADTGQDSKLAALRAGGAG
jgi:tetratricopeptide (TPR) repeat protein